MDRSSNKHGEDVRDADINTLCSTQLVTVGPDDTAETAAELMRSHTMRRLPVVENGEAVGIVSLGDLAASLDPASALGAISSAPPTR
jgi:CBS domain-containing protein